MISLHIAEKVETISTKMIKERSLILQLGSLVVQHFSRALTARVYS
jgi:hypothetical protein